MAVPAAAQEADFSLSGFARMGVAYDDGSDETALESRFQLDARFEIVADAGLTFGGHARMRIDEGSADAGFNQPRLYMSSGDLTLSVGNINGVIFNVPASYVGTGLDGNGSSGTPVYFSGAQNVTPLEYSSQGVSGTNGAQLDYSMGGFGFSAMYTDEASGVSMTYSANGVSIGVAYQQDDVTSADDDTLIVVGASYEIDALTVGAAYAVVDDASMPGDGSKFSVNASYAFSEALSGSAFVATEDNGAGDGESYGVSMTRSLAPGVNFVAGFEQNAAETNFMSAGVTMNF